MLVERKRLVLRLPVPDWVAQVEALPFLTLVPVDNRVALRAANLDGFSHADPADRMIVATAIGLGATLVTADAQLRKYPHLKSAWS